MQPLLLTTKTHLPPLTADRIPRQRLLARLATVLEPGKRLALVCAPAGYGKTTLVSDWMRAGAHPAGTTFCWLSLEVSDSHPGQFLMYLTAALKPALGEDWRALWEAATGPAWSGRAALPALINALAGASGQTVLALDDYQSIHEAETHALVSDLLDHLPETARVVIATRADPPLPLHRFRARGELVEIRMDELRFTQEESGRFLSSAAGVSLRPEDRAVLETRTEGWAAGLRLATLSLRGRTDPAAFVRSLSGSNRFILDYLTEEALKNQPEVTQSFLLYTSILERFNAELCAVVTGLAEADGILAGLERANLFLVPLDDERRWYRYHHLFGDLLQVRLRQEAQTRPGLEEELHRRAAGWLEENGWVWAAIEHSIAARQYEQAAQLVEQHTLRLFADGNLSELLRWIRLLPPELAARRPQLAVHQAWALVFAGRLEQIEATLRPVEVMMTREEIAAQETRRLRADMTAIRAMAAFTAGDIPGALALAGQTGPDFPPESRFALSVIRWVQGFAARMQGDLVSAEQAFREVLEIGRALNNVWTVATASVDLGTALRESGRLRAAEQVYRQGLEEVRQAGAGAAGYIGRLESFIASVRHEQNDLEEAARLAEAAIRHNRLWQNPNHSVHAYQAAARTAFSRGDLAGMEQALDAAEELKDEPGLLPTLRATGAGLRARLLLARGQTEEAERAYGEPSLPAGAPNLYREIALVTAARVRLARGNRSAALARLDDLERIARTGGRRGTLIETLILKALAVENPQEAAAAVDEALALGLPEGYARVYLDEGTPLRALLAGAVERFARQGAGQANLARQTAALLENLPPAAPAPPLVDRNAAPLTGREMDILRAMAEGLSNPQIGRRFYLSVGTVKAHSAAIYRKLDVANRAEAVARAKDLGLL